MADAVPVSKPPKLLYLPILLSLNAGYTDAAGYLALQGLFTAHVTGNFVTLGATLVLGTAGVVAKLLSLPVFCAGVLLTRLLAFALVARRLPDFRILLTLKVLLLTLGAALALRYGPFVDGESPHAILTGMVLVLAMSIQNAMQRLHLGSAPPSTLMTGTTTQIMIDAAGLIHGMPAEQRPAVIARFSQMLAGLAVFAFGCALAALLFAKTGMWCFVLPPLFALGAMAVRPPEVKR